MPTGIFAPPRRPISYEPFEYPRLSWEDLVRLNLVILEKFEVILPVRVVYQFTDYRFPAFLRVAHLDTSSISGMTHILEETLDFFLVLDDSPKTILGPIEGNILNDTLYYLKFEVKIPYIIQIYKVGEHVQRVKDIKIMFPSQETMDRRDKEYITKVGELTTLMDEKNLSFEVMEAFLDKIYMESRTNSKVRELFKILLLMIMEEN